VRLWGDHSRGRSVGTGSSPPRPLDERVVDHRLAIGDQLAQLVDDGPVGRGRSASGDAVAVVTYKSPTPVVSRERRSDAADTTHSTTMDTSTSISTPTPTAHSDDHGRPSLPDAL
jgi:hypothetical protein